MRLLEVCVDDAEGLTAAVAGGADRVELCCSLGVGGLTPSAGLMAEAARLPIPAIALIRPRSGGFVYSAAEERVMLRDIELAADSGLAGVAIGALTPRNDLDLPLLHRLTRRAQGLQLTLHRAFDLARDPSAALEDAIALGFHRVLTSGGAAVASAGTARLAALVTQSRGRTRILAGSGIRPENVQQLVRLTGVDEVHASCRTAASAPHPRLDAFGFADRSAGGTSADLVKTLGDALHAEAQPCLNRSTPSL